MNLSKFLVVSILALTAASAAYADTTSTGSTVVTGSPGTYSGSTRNGMGSVGNMAGGSTKGSMSRNSATSNTASMAAQAPANGVIADPKQVASCLCMENQYKSLQTDMSAKQTAYNQATAQEASMGAQLASAQGGDLNQIRNTSEQRIELQNQINAQYIPNLQMATDRYNGAVTAYQQTCSGHMFNADVMAQVQTHLSCSAQ